MHKINILLILFATAIAQILMWSTGHNWGDDFSAYIMQSISLTDGTMQDFVENNKFTLNESSSPMGPVTYPWGFPMLMAPIYMLFGFNIIAFKTLILITFLSFLVVLWFIFNDEFSTNEKLVYVSLFSFNPLFLSFGDNILSDIPFLFFSTLSIFLFSFLHKAKSLFALYGISILLGLSFSASTAIRTNGILLPLTYLLMLFLHILRPNIPYVKYLNTSWLVISESRNIFIKFFAYSLPLITFSFSSWLLSTSTPDHQSSHLDFLSSISIESVIGNIKYYGILIKDFYGTSRLNILLYFSSIPFLLLGLKEKCLNSTAILIYVLLTFVLYILWPHQQGVRFIFPILPFYVYYIFIGLRIFNHKKIGLKSIKLLFPILLLVILALESSVQIYRNFDKKFILSDGPYTTESQEMFSFINNNLSQDSIIIFFKPRAMRLFTSRKSIYYSHIDDFKFRQWYVIDKKNLHSSVDKYPEKLFALYPATLMFENSQYKIFKFE